MSPHPAQSLQPWLASALLLLASAGCATRFHQANLLASQGKFVEAAELFETLAREQPQDPEVAQLRERWNVKLDGALESTVNEEREDFTRYLTERVSPHLQNDEALAAERELQAHDFLLSHVEVSRLASGLRASVRESGQAACARLRPAATADSPYLSALIARYCQHFTAEAPREWPLLDTFSAAHVTSQLSGASGGLAGRIEGALRRQLEAGPWYLARGNGSVALRATGSAVSTRSETPVLQSAGWTEQVPYLVNVTKTLSEKVPVNECETTEESAPASQGGGKRQVVKQVTREKTKTREVVVQETRFRDVPRVFEYQALRLERRSNLEVRLELAGAEGVLAATGVQRSESRSGLWHEVTFAPAHVAPQHADLGSLEQWLEQQVDEVAASFDLAQRDGWRARFCKTSLSPEEAARCLRVGPSAPPAAAQALVPLLRADAKFAANLF